MHSHEIQTHLERAEASLKAAKLLRESGLLDDSASRSYYAVFHAASAVLLSRGLSFNSHAGVLRAINLHFVKTGELDRKVGQEVNWLAELRQIGDYGESRHVDDEAAEQAIALAEDFLLKITNILAS